MGAVGGVLRGAGLSPVLRATVHVLLHCRLVVIQLLTGEVVQLKKPTGLYDHVGAGVTRDSILGNGLEEKMRESMLTWRKRTQLLVSDGELRHLRELVLELVCLQLSTLLRGSHGTTFFSPSKLGSPDTSRLHHAAQVRPNKIKAMYLMCTGGEVSAICLGPKIVPLSLSSKKVGDDIAKVIGDWKGLRITVKLTIQNTEAQGEVVPSASALIKKPPRDREKPKNIRHNGNIPFHKIVHIARELSGTIKEILGTAQSVGCNVDGCHPHDINDDINNGVEDTTAVTATVLETGDGVELLLPLLLLVTREDCDAVITTGTGRDALCWTAALATAFAVTVKAVWGTSRGISGTNLRPSMDHSEELLGGTISLQLMVDSAQSSATLYPICQLKNNLILFSDDQSDVARGAPKIGQSDPKLSKSTATSWDYEKK
ncbi:hypothetical protein U0070_010284 [Myodes glareolus]|uniref:Large ribosomal subunit protein uL11 n=1 Tax=Myodes glareolus TaxID=447135 RepID=A0AAW0HXR5_MYOGA